MTTETEQSLVFSVKLRAFRDSVVNQLSCTSAGWMTNSSAPAGGGASLISRTRQPGCCSVPVTGGVPVTLPKTRMAERVEPGRNRHRTAFLLRHHLLHHEVLLDRGLGIFVDVANGLADSGVRESGNVFHQKVEEPGFTLEQGEEANRAAPLGLAGGGGAAGVATGAAPAARALFFHRKNPAMAAAPTTNPATPYANSMNEPRATESVLPRRPDYDTMPRTRSTHHRPLQRR